MGTAYPNDKIGSLSGMYESGNDPGRIANNKGDIGGASYGSHQLTVASGHAQKFANSYGGALKGLTAGTAAFNKAWSAEAKKNPTKFGDAQYSYMMNNHYTPAANAFTKATGINLNGASKALQEVVLSVGVQHGAGGAASLFKAAGVAKGMSDETIIKKLYEERRNVDKYFKSSSQAIKNSVKSRFFKEEQQALSMLATSSGALGKAISGAASKVMSKAISVGQSLIGNTKYKLGAGRNEKDIANGVFDCSSFIHYALKQAGKNIGPLNSVSTETLKKQGQMVGAKNMKPGDLVFFNTYKKDGHVGIYLGDNKFIGAQTSTGVGIVDMTSSYWKDRFSGHVRRV